MVELVLILLVTVSLVIGAKKVFTPLSDFMNDYMGNYVACLMEYGELPSRGVQSNDLKKHQGGSGGGKVCEAKFKGFTLNAGFQANSSNSGSGSGSAAAKDGSTAGKKSTDPKASDTIKAKENSSSSARTSSSGGRAGSRSTSSAANETVRRSGAAFGTADGPSSAASKVKVTEADDEKLGENNRAGQERNSSRVSYARTAYRGVSGKMGEEIEKSIKKSTRAPSSQIVASIEDGYRLKLYKKTFTPPETKSYTPPEEEAGFNFGNILKWLIIAGLVIAAFILFGGQILNYSNSKD